ncbi:MAG: DUF1467 family protein [Pseudomonadota bacterium]
MGIGIGSAIALYFIFWWIAFFIVLPLGFRAVTPKDELVKGQEAGAPAIPKLRLKAMIATVLAAVIFAAFLVILNSGLRLEDIPLPAPPGV